MEFTETISVVMPTYNTPVPILKEAVDSILSQTFRDFVFIIVDDGSTNESAEYLKSLTDPRIRLYRNEPNLGLTKSLNIGFEKAKGKYIARMDSDDVSLPERLEKQFEWMEQHPDMTVCGTRFRNFGADDHVLNAEEQIPDMERYRIKTLFRYPGPCSPTAFFNHALLLQNGLRFDEKLIYAQDYGLWADIGWCGRVGNLNEVLFNRRVHSAQITGKHRERQIRCDQMTQEKLLRPLLGDVTQEELDRHYRFSSADCSEPICPQMEEWYRRLKDANKRTKTYDRRKFNGFIDWEILRPAIRRSFLPDTSLKRKVGLFSRYLPFFTALRATFMELQHYMPRTAALLRRLKRR